jgi:tetratricopeptide (TPR) repeat protein
MLSQIIFFVAVALLVVFLLSRSVIVRKSANPSDIKSQSLRWPKINLGLLSTAWSGVVSWFSQIKLPKRMPGISRAVSNGVSHQKPTSNDQKFWQEEASGSEMSLGSNFEEGETLYKEGKLPEAEQFYIKAAANHPGDAKVYARLGLLYLQMKNYSDAIEALKVASKLDKYNPSRYYNLALAYSGNKDTQKAISAVREAITLDPVTPKYRQLLEKLMNG